MMTSSAFASPPRRRVEITPVSRFPIRSTELATPRPEAINPGITGPATEWVYFRLMSAEAWHAVEKRWRDSGIIFSREQIAALPLGSFVAWNRLSGGSLYSRVF